MIIEKCIIFTIEIILNLKGEKMPIRVANDIPAKNQLTEEGIIFIEETRANTQDIRPLNILILNLMPKKRRN